MPSIIVHHLFANNIYNEINNKNNNLEKSKLIYKTFAQSHDYLYYFKNLNTKYSKEINELGHIAHREKTQTYFINLISYIKDNNLEKDSDIIAYLYGSLTHYILDANCHPFIFYKTGTYNKKNCETEKYHGEHTHIEKELDAYYFQKYYQKKYKYCNVSKDIIKKPIFSEELIKAINYTYETTYNEKNIGQVYIQSLKVAKFIYTIIINDRFGWKRKLYSLIDKVTKKKFGNLASYSTHIDNPNLNFLNLNHQTWNHPCFKEKTYNYSFDDLIKISHDECLNIINEIEKVLYQNQNLNSLYKIIPNKSYLTGLPLEENKKMRYFEY